MAWYSMVWMYHNLFNHHVLSTKIFVFALTNRTEVIKLVLALIYMARVSLG